MKPGLQEKSMRVRKIRLERREEKRREGDEVAWMHSRHFKAFQGISSYSRSKRTDRSDLQTLFLLHVLLFSKVVVPAALLFPRISFFTRSSSSEILLYVFPPIPSLSALSLCKRFLQSVLSLLFHDTREKRRRQNSIEGEKRNRPAIVFIPTLFFLHFCWRRHLLLSYSWHHCCLSSSSSFSFIQVKLSFDERQSLLFCFIFLLLFLTRFLMQSFSVCSCHFIRHLSSFYHFFSIRVFTSFFVVFFSSKGRQLVFCLMCFSKKRWQLLFFSFASLDFLSLSFDASVSFMSTVFRQKSRNVWRHNEMLDQRKKD